MALQKDVKTKIVEKFRRDKNDTGSVEVQVAILTKEIEELTKHLNEHIHDFHSKRGLLMKVGKRRNLLEYLKKTDVTRYRELIKALNLRK